MKEAISIYFCKRNLNSDCPFKPLLSPQSHFFPKEVDEETRDTGRLCDVTQVPHVTPAIYVPGLNLQKPFSLRLKYRFSQVIKQGRRIKLFATQTCWLVPFPNCQIKYLPRVVYLLVFRTVYTGVFFVVVTDLVKLSPIPMNQQQFPFGNAQWNATCNCSGIIQAEVPPSFLDLPSPQVKSREQTTADMTRHIQCIAETLNHSLATESTPLLQAQGPVFEEKQTRRMQVHLSQSYSFCTPIPAKANQTSENSLCCSSALKTENRTFHLWYYRRDKKRRKNFQVVLQKIYFPGALLHTSSSTFPNTFQDSRSATFMQVISQTLTDR